MILTGKWLILLLTAGVLGAAAFAAGRTETETVCNLPAGPAALKGWESTNPSAVSIGYLPQGGQGGKGALVFRILKPGGIVEVNGPEFQLPKRPVFVSTRRLELTVQARQEECENGAVQFRIRQNNGRWAGAVRPRRDWDTVLDMVEAWEWKKWGLWTEYGNIGNGTTSARVVLRIDTRGGKGTLLIEKLEIKEITIINHSITTGAEWNTFFGDSGKFCVRWFRPEQIKEAKLNVIDEEKKTVKALVVGPGVQQTEVRLPERGYYEITASALYRDGKKLDSTCTVGVIGKPIPEEIRRHSRYGIMRVHASGDWAKRIGSNYDWGFWTLDNVAPGPDGKIVSHFPKPPQNAKKRDFLYHAGMHGVLPKWLQQPKAKNQYLFAPNDWKRYAEAVEVWARDNPDLPDVVSIYNEPNAHWRGTEEEFIKFHNVTTDAIKKGRPGTKVGGPVLYRILMKDFKRYVEKGILNNMDYVVMHAYVHSTPPEREFIENIIAMQEFLKTTKYARLPIALTEFGWTGYPGDWQKPVTELEKARYCVRSLLLCTARNIDTLIYFNARYAQAADEYNYSIVKPDYTPLPAFVSFSTFLREMSTVKGGGQYFKLAPDVFWTGFKRDGKTLAALWTMDRKIRLTLPAMPLSLRSMMGKSLAPVRVPELSPSPVYAEFADPAIAEMKVGKIRDLLPGSAISLDAEEILVPPFLTLEKPNTIRFPVTAPLGEYTILFRKNGLFHAQPVHLIRPFTLEFRDWKWNGTDAKGILVFRAVSHLPGKTEVGLELKLAGKTVASRSIALESGKEKELSFSLPFSSGKRMTGELLLQCGSPIRWTAAQPFDTTPMAIPLFERTSPDVWKSLPELDITRWGRTEEYKPGELSSVSAGLKLFAAPDGIHLLLRVHDKDHVQNDLWQDMWKEDSIQIGFDLDADKEWQPNNVGHGLNGHRVVEYGLAARSKGRPQGWCFLGYADGVKSGPAFELMDTIKVRHDKASGVTIYEALFPWKLLGATGTPDPDSRIGMALLINDAGTGHGRKILRFFDGVSSKNPEKYGRIQLYRKTK